MRRKSSRDMERRRSQQLSGSQKYHIALIVVGIILGLLLSGTAKAVIEVIDSQQRALAIEQARVLQPYRIAAQQVAIMVGILVRVGLFVLGGYIAFYLVAIARNWLDLKARQVHARDGVFPVIRVDNGTLYDPNRAMGDHPIVTMGALEVQRASALRADKIQVKQESLAALPPGSQEQSQESVNLDNVISLPGVCPNPSLDRLVLGLGQSGQVITASLHDLMHVLAVGASGWGKSAFLRMLIWQIAQASEPVDVVAIDINGSEFNTIRQWERLRYPVAREPQDAAAVLNAVAVEIAQRKQLYEQFPMAHDLPSYNRRADTQLSPMVILMDEGTSLLNHDGMADPLREVTQSARQYGIYLLLAGQSANHKVIPTQTRDNFTSRFCFHTSPASRRVVLGQSVDNVSQRGRAWAQLPGREIEQIKVPFASREDVGRVITTGRPRQEIPEIPDITKAKIVADDANLPEVERVQLLKEQGLSLNEIQRRVYGYVGGAAYDAVKRALE